MEINEFLPRAGTDRNQDAPREVDQNAPREPTECFLINVLELEESMRKLLTVVLLTVSLSLFVTACGGSGGNAPSKSIKVTLGDLYFAPKTFIVPVGELISFTAVNIGAHLHSFVIMQKGKTVQGHWSDAADLPNVYWSMGGIAPGKTFTGSFTAPDDPGEYQIICEVAGHFEAGMVAKLIVVSP